MVWERKGLSLNRINMNIRWRLHSSTGVTHMENRNLARIHKVMFWSVLFSMILLCACGKKEQETGKIYHIYSLNNEETAITSHDYRTETTDQKILLQELLEQLSAPADKLQYRAPLSWKCAVAFRIDHRGAASA